MSTSVASNQRGPAAIRAYYNEIDPFAADWIRALMAHGLIASGDVDTRSITDVKPSDLRGYTQCHFFAGIGGWSYALRQAGWDDTRPVWTGSCPCQPFSSAGRQRGFDDERHLWPVWRELIRECAPAVVFGEQVANATEWLGLVRGDLEAMGRAVGAMPIQAASAGADHLRDRYWFVAHTPGAGSLPGSFAGLHRGKESAGPRDGQPERRGGALDMGDGAGDGRNIGARSPASRLHVSELDIADSSGGDLAQSDIADQRGYAGCARSAPDQGGGEARKEDGNATDGACAGSLNWVIGADGKARRVKPGIRLLAHGVPNRVGTLRGFGNAIDPRPAAEFIKAASEAISAQPALSVSSNARPSGSPDPSVPTQEA